MSTNTDRFPVSWCVFRGYSRTGIGEGSDYPITRGEQYLAADLPLARNQLLAKIRPWMTLDSEPVDHQRLHDELESWSCFCHENLLFVVRLTPAGTYDRHAAYFAHGRAWPMEEPPPYFDPGTHLGRSELFEKPWWDGQQAERVTEIWPFPVRPEQLGAEPEVAVHLLAHYFQACEQGYPLIVAVPISEFRIGQPLHALVCFARAGLPADLKHRAFIRIFTRLPEVFLNELGANLIVVPTDMAGTALGACREQHATLLDRQADIKDGREVEKRFLAYARAVLENTLQVPAGLLPFAERFGRLRRTLALPQDSDVRIVHLGYNLALAMVGTELERERFFHEYLLDQPKLLVRLPIECLVEPEEWSCFPIHLLTDFVLQPPEDLVPSQRVLQEVIMNTLARTRPFGDTALTAWWDPTDETKLRRLLELLANDSSLIDTEAAAQRTVEIPAVQLLASGRPQFGALKAELAAGVIDRRAQESADLAELATDIRNFIVLAKATSEGQLDSAWAVAFVRSTEPDRLVSAAICLFQDVQGWNAWDNVPKLLLNRLRASKRLPINLLKPIVEAGQFLDPLRDFSVYIRLADLFALICSGKVNPLLARLQEILPALNDPIKARFLAEIALDKDWAFLWPRDLVRDGDLLLPYSTELAEIVLTNPQLIDLLDGNGLLRLATVTEDNDLEIIYSALDRRLVSDPEGSTAALVKQGWWYAWRSRSSLPSAVLRQVALAWLSCELWRGEDPPETNLETWHKAIEDVGETLSGEEMSYLCSAQGPAWPCIIPFEQDQVADLCRLSGDLSALAELAEILRPNLFVCTLEINIEVYLLSNSQFAGRLPASSIGWLRDETPALEPLNLEQSLILWQNSGCRREQALTARAHTIAVCLHEDPVLALTSAGEPLLWNHKVFLESLADWLREQGPLELLDKKVVEMLEQCLTLHSVRSTAAPPWTLCAELVQSGYTNVAEFLCPCGTERINEEILHRRVVAALVAGDVKDACWSELISEPAKLSSIAARLRNGKDIGSTQQAWKTFRAVLREHPALLASVADRPGLPAMELATALLGNGAVGLAALSLIFVDSGCRIRSGPDWWQALDYSIAQCHNCNLWYSGDDNLEIARALIHQCLDDLSKDERWAYTVTSDIHRTRPLFPPTPDAE